MPHPIEVINRALFWPKVDRVGGPGACWPWTGTIDRYGYGQYKQTTDGIQSCWRAHRVAYELTVDPIPDGLQLDHLCHTNDPDCPGGPDCVHRACTNPAHLEPVTNEENGRRGVRAPLITPDLLPSVIALYRGGLGAAKIGLRYGVTDQTILRALGRAGVPTRRRGRPVGG